LFPYCNKKWFNVICCFHHYLRNLQAQNFLVIIIVAAIVDFIVGAIIGPTDALQEAQGFAGFNCKYAMDCP
jgi:hypothetical protein